MAPNPYSLRYSSALLQSCFRRRIKRELQRLINMKSSIYVVLFVSWIKTIVVVTEHSIPLSMDIGSASLNPDHEVLSIYGFLHTCAVFKSFKLKCFGYNKEGQLGYGDNKMRGDEGGEMGNNLAFVDLGDDAAVLQVSSGVTHTCVFCNNSRIKCFGDGRYGQLGYGDTVDRGLDPSEMGNNLDFIDLGTGLEPIQVSVGSWHTCVLFSNSKVKCFGFPGENGRAAEMGDQLDFIDLGNEAEIKEISSGGYHTCALFSNSKMKCFGMNIYGQLGYGDLNGRTGGNLSFVNLGTDLAVKQIAGGFMHTCVLFETSKVKCFGNNTFGQLGYGDKKMRGGESGQMGNQLPFVSLGTEATIESISAGYAHTCVLFSGSRVKCFGYNEHGQLGYGDTNNRGDDKGEMRQELGFVDIGTDVKIAQLNAGILHTCVLLTSSYLKCFGNNEFGQLGYGDTENRGDDKREMGNNLDFVDLGRPENIYSFSGALGGFRDPIIGPVECDGTWKYVRPGTGRVDPRIVGKDNCLPIDKFKPHRWKNPKFSGSSAAIQAAVPEGYVVDTTRWCSFTKRKCGGNGDYRSSSNSKRIGSCTKQEAREAWGYCMHKIDDAKRYGAGAFKDPETTGMIQCDDNWLYLPPSSGQKRRVSPDQDNCLDIAAYPPFKSGDVSYPAESINVSRISQRLRIDGQRWCSIGARACKRRGNTYSPLTPSSTEVCTKGMLRRAWAYCLYERDTTSPTSKPTSSPSKVPLPTIPRAIGGFRDPKAGPIECDHGAGLVYKKSSNSGAQTVLPDANSTFSISAPTKPFFRNGGTTVDYPFEAILPEDIPQGFYASSSRWCSFKQVKCKTKNKVYIANPKSGRNSNCPRRTQRLTWGYALLPLAGSGD